MSAIIWPEENLLVGEGAFPARTDRHILSGVIKDDGVPVARRVALLTRDTLDLVAVTRSRPDGTYQFRGLPEYPARSLLIVWLDDEHEGRHNAECLDFVTQIVDQEVQGP